MITLEDRRNPVFTYRPVDITLSCGATPAPEDLDWIDNCDGSGTVSGIDSGADPILRAWTYTDGCGNAITHTQNITIQDVSPVGFHPELSTIACEEEPLQLVAWDIYNAETTDFIIPGWILK